MDSSLLCGSCSELVQVQLPKENLSGCQTELYLLRNNSSLIPQIRSPGSWFGSWWITVFLIWERWKCDNVSDGIFNGTAFFALISVLIFLCFTFLSTSYSFLSLSLFCFYLFPLSVWLISSSTHPFLMILVLSFAFSPNPYLIICVNVNLCGSMYSSLALLTYSATSPLLDLFFSVQLAFSSVSVKNTRWFAGGNEVCQIPVLLTVKLLCLCQQHWFKTPLPFHCPFQYLFRSAVGLIRN